MRIADIIGRVTLSRAHPSLKPGSWLIAVPLLLEGIVHADQGRQEPLVVFDETGAGQGARIAIAEGTEAAAPFYPQLVPVDAYCAAILDTVEVDLRAMSG